MIKMFLLTFLITAVWADCRSGRISNRLIIAGWISGLAVSIRNCGFSGIASFLTGALLPVVLFSLLFLMHALGAGDIKLLSVTTCFFTVKEGMIIILLSLCVAAVLSLGKMVFYNNLFTRFIHFEQYVYRTLSSGKIGIYESEKTKENSIHFSIAVLAGCAIYLGVISCRKF